MKTACDVLCERHVRYASKDIQHKSTHAYSKALIWNHIMKLIQYSCIYCTEFVSNSQFADWFHKRFRCHMPTWSVLVKAGLHDHINSQNKPRDLPSWPKTELTEFKTVMYWYDGSAHASIALIQPCEPVLLVTEKHSLLFSVNGVGRCITVWC